MELKKKLILEELEEPKELPDAIAPIEIPTEQPAELTPAEETSFHIGTVTDLLNRYLDIYSSIKSISADELLDADVKGVLESVSDDTAVCIGKLQECLKVCSDGDDGELIARGEQEIQKEVIPTEE